VLLRWMVLGATGSGSDGVRLVSRCDLMYIRGEVTRALVDTLHLLTDVHTQVQGRGVWKRATPSGGASARLPPCGEYNCRTLAGCARDVKGISTTV
jgi:hypothetical protein